MPDIFDNLFRVYLRDLGINTQKRPQEPVPTTMPRTRFVENTGHLGNKEKTQSEETLGDSIHTASDSDVSSATSNALGQAHSEKSKFKCNFQHCGKEFMRKEHLNRHTRIHTQK